MKHLARSISIISTLIVAQTATPSRAQTPDSLANYLRTHVPTDTTYVRTLDKVIYATIYQKADYARADSMSRQMGDIAQKMGDWNGVVRSHRNRATIYYLKASYDQALVYFKKTLEVTEQHNMPPLLIYGALTNVAIGYDKLGNDQLVLETALKAIQMQERFNLRPRAPVPHQLIGGALVKLGRAQQAIPYYREAGVIFRENGDPRGIGIFEKQLGDFYNDINQPARAVPHFKEALNRAGQLTFELLRFDALDGLAKAMRMLNKPDNGLAYARKALQIVEKQQNKLGICTVYGTTADLYTAKKDYPTAEAYLKKALTLAEENEYKDERKKLVQQLADLYGEQNKYHLAYTFQLEKNKQVDSATTIRTNAEVQRMVANYETEKKEAQIRLLQKDKQLQRKEVERAQFKTNALLIGSVLLLLLAGAVSAWLLNRARLQRLQEAQQLRQQIARDLHDEVGSTLSSISLLSGHTDTLLTQNRPESAQKMVQKIYTDARQILESIDEIIWTINPGNDSLQRVAFRLQEYAQPLMESQTIHFSFVTDPGLEDMPISMELRRNLYLIGKEAINNLVKYSQATEATVRFERTGNQLRVLIEDNGQGFDTTQRSQRTGQVSMQQRAKAMGGTLNVQSEPGQGTRLRVTVNA